MNCTNCGGPLRHEPGRDYLICDACRSIRHLEAEPEGLFLLGPVTSLNCPVCGIGMVNAVALGQSVHYCTNCRGSLIATDVFMYLVAHLRVNLKEKPHPPRPIEPSELVRVVKCPLCSRAMDTHPYAGPGNIVIDNCPTCSVNWVDARELYRVASAPDESPNRDAWQEP